MNKIVEKLPMIGMVWGILAILPAVIGLIPCFGWIEWLVVFFGWILWIPGLIVNSAGIFLAYKSGSPMKKNIIGLICCILVLGTALVRIALSYGLGSLLWFVLSMITLGFWPMIGAFLPFTWPGAI